MDELQAEFPDITEVYVMGGTVEGRQIRGLRIVNEENLEQSTLPIIFITAGVSARDWISIMAALNVMHELVEHYDEFANIVDSVRWYVIPVGKLDDYECSQCLI